MQPLTIKDYLNDKHIKYHEHGKELITHCLFNDCDKDSKGNEAHLYFNAQTGQYQCKKCLTEGNMLTLMKHLGDNPGDYEIAGHEKVTFEPRATAKKNTIEEKDVLKYHKALPKEIREYLVNRGITDAIINEKKLGYGTFHGQTWITIPIRDRDGEILFFKLRRSPEREEGNKYMFYPSGNESQLYGQNCLIDNDDYVFICEGEFDQMILEREGLPAITSTGGAGTFKSDWIELLKDMKTVFIAFDNDEAGVLGANKLANTLNARFPYLEIKIVMLPPEKGKDISEYFLHDGTIDGLVSTYSETTLGVKTDEFAPMDITDIQEVLSLTIREDNINKVVVFLAMLSAFTDDSQINILLNAPSSSGKSYIPLQIAQLFPEDAIMKLQYVSQNAFFHENGEYDKEKNETHIRLDRKIIIFIDQPRTELLARLRPLLSHDEKVMVSKITDKSGKGGNKTKNVVIHGYPTAIFCTASTQMDEQEATRFLLISPETTQKKLQATIENKICYESDKDAIKQSVMLDTERKRLVERIAYIRDAKIDDVVIENTDSIRKHFLGNSTMLHPRDQRDIGRLMAFIKCFTLLNMTHRKRIGSTLYATEDDIQEAFTLWNAVSPGQKYGVSPYMLEIYEMVFLPAYREYNAENMSGPFRTDTLMGIPRLRVLKKHMEVYGRTLSDARWRQELEPTLENAGLIYKEHEGRTVLLSPPQGSMEVNNSIS